MSLESYEQLGVVHDHEYLAELALKLGYDPQGENHNLQVLDQTAQYLHAVHQSVPEELECRRSELEARWLGGTLIRWLDIPAPNETATMSNADRLGGRLQQTIHWADDGAEKLAFVTLPARNERYEIDNAFDSYQVPHKYPIAAIVVGDSLCSDDTVMKVLRRNGNIARSFTRGIGPARRVAFDHIRDPKVARPRLASNNEFYYISDSDATASPAITDVYIDALDADDTQLKLIGRGPVRYSFLWEDMPRLDTSGRVVVPGDQSGELATAFAAEDVAFIGKYRDPDDPYRIHIRDFPSYQYFNHTKSISECVNDLDLGVDIRDIVRGSRCHMLPGPSTMLRGTFLDIISGLPDVYNIPNDMRYEMHHAALAWQNLYDFDRIGVTIGDGDSSVGVMASERAIVGREAYVGHKVGELAMSRLTTSRLLAVRRGNGVMPYKIDLGPEALDEQASIARTIHELAKAGALQISMRGRQ